jgi:DNA-binding MarR family transcriptional regulator
VQEVEPSLIYVVGRVNQGILREMRTILGEWDLSPQEYTALSVLGVRPGLSNAQLARRALVTPQSMIAILGRLQERGLVKRTADPAHGRILRTTPTRKGKALLDKADSAIREMQDRILSAVPLSQQKVALQTLMSAMRELSR